MSLIITGVIDGPIAGGMPKAIELYALADISDLSIYGIGSANNGGGSVGQEFMLSGSASAGDFIYIAMEATQFQNFFGFAPTFTTGTLGATNINGNDAIELFQNGIVIDVFGEISVDGSGQPWEYTDGWAYRQSNTTVDGTTFNLANWTFSGPNALDGEATNIAAATPFPSSVFSRNSAPVLTDNATFTPIAEDIPDTSNLGNTIAELASTLITDADFDPEGIAITSVDNANGTWQYSTDGGVSWTDFGASITANNAVTLGATSIYTGYATDPNQDTPSEQGLLEFASVVLAFPPQFPQTETVDPVGVTVDTTGNDDIYAGYSNFIVSPALSPAGVTFNFTPVSNNFPILDSDAGYTLSFTAQVLEETVQPGRPRAAFSVIAVSQDSTKAIELAFQNGNIFAQTLDGTNQFVASTTDFTTAHDVTQATQYSLSVQGTEYTLSADGTSILTGTLQDYTPGNVNGGPNPYSQPNFVFFGDDTTSAQGRFRINQIAVETPTRIRFQPNADYSGDATLQFRAWDTTDGSDNGQTGVDAAQTGGTRAFSAVLGTGTIAVLPEDMPVSPTPPSSTPSLTTNTVFNFEQWVLYETIRFGKPFQSNLVDFDIEISGLRVAPLFDETQYLADNPDVTLAIQQGQFQYGFEHFVLFGINEGRSPGDWFDETYYLAQNSDVATALNSGEIGSAIAHFFAFGHREGRNPSQFFDNNDYLLNNPDVQSALNAGIYDSPFDHYAEHGAEEGRVSGWLFEEAFYLRQNPDVATAVQQGEFALGLHHFLSFGQSEGRDPSALFDQSAYLERYSDVAAAVAGGNFASGFEHYVLFGRTEGRITI